MSAAETFRALHRDGTFVLVNVHDAGTAAFAQEAGAVALGTTSAGHAYSLGRRPAHPALRRLDRQRPATLTKRTQNEQRPRTRRGRCFD